MWVNLLGVALVLPRFRLGDRCGHGEQLSGLGEAVGALAVGEHPVVANAVEAFGKTWERKRRMNSPVASIMTLKRPGPSTR